MVEIPFRANSFTALGIEKLAVVSEKLEDIVYRDFFALCENPEGESHSHLIILGGLSDIG